MVISDACFNGDHAQCDGYHTHQVAMDEYDSDHCDCFHHVMDEENREAASFWWMLGD